MSLDINLKTFAHCSGFCALASVSLADKPLGQYASGGAGGFGGGGFGGSGSAFGAGGGFGDDSQYAGGAGGDNLEEVIPGIPGDDYPIFAEVPDTSFFCDGQTDGGYYSDPEAECQAFHICAGDGTGGLTKYSFLCPNGTLFNQQYFVCDWWFNVDCSLAKQFYILNDQIAAERHAHNPGGDGGYYGGAEAGGQGGQGGRAADNRGSFGFYTAPAGGDFGRLWRGDFGGDSGFGSAGYGYGVPVGGSLSRYGDLSKTEHTMAEEYIY